MAKQNPVKIGVIGVGHLGRFHVQQLSTIENVELVGIFDVNTEQCTKVGTEFSVATFSKADLLMQACDAISIVTPTTYHFEMAMQALHLDCHVFIEKPITETIEQAQQLLDKAELCNKIIQVGHIERFNPAFLHVKNQNLSPKFVEIHRLAPFNPRGTDVPVILDLMIHDIDILLSMVSSSVKDIQASGVKVVSKTVDIANARISFENGCVANITASRISKGPMRKMRIFQEATYTTVDFLQKSVEIYHVEDELPDGVSKDSVFPLEGHEKKYVIYEKPEVVEHNALREELYHFASVIQQGEKPDVDGHSAAAALHIALEIQKIIDSTIA
ncbi:MAG: Gfo/Idh/MocA family oxidoreductase [Candidatus Marinimicrobia bacterium]|nr:Gfo/Idh/MocA family oxidoreductase [Candidatus Neomarinimicrobiota bacterium]